jgi:hypothetical protein
MAGSTLEPLPCVVVGLADVIRSRVTQHLPVAAVRGRDHLLLLVPAIDRRVTSCQQISSSRLTQHSAKTGAKAPTTLWRITVSCR